MLRREVGGGREGGGGREEEGGREGRRERGGGGGGGGGGGREDRNSKSPYSYSCVTLLTSVAIFMEAGRQVSVASGG